MRVVTLILLSLAACAASAPPRPARTPAPQATDAPKDGAFRFDVDGSHAADFVIEPGWSELPRDRDGSTVLVDHGRDDLALSVALQEAAPGSTVEEVVVMRMRMLASGPQLFRIRKIEEPVIASETEASFGVVGTDEGGVEMRLVCRIRLVSLSPSDWWSTVIALGPERERQLFEPRAEQASKTLRITRKNP